MGFDWVSSPMVVAQGQQYNIGERSTVIQMVSLVVMYLFFRFHRDTRTLCVVVMYLYPYYTTINNYHLLEWHGRCKPGGEYTPA